MQGHFAAISALRAALRAVALRNAPAGAVRAASDFLDAQKVTKRRQGVGTIGFGCASSSMIPTP